MNYTYIVQCADGTLYTGWTNCLARRMKAHNEGKAGAKYTRAKRPVKLCHKGGGHEPGVPDQAADQGEEAGVDEVLNFDKHFDISKGFKCVEHYAAELKDKDMYVLLNLIGISA